VSADINTLAQALAAFKTKYGDYPPSRIILCEDGNYLQAMTNTAINPGDITFAQLAQRSVSILRKMFPRVTLSTSGDVFGGNSTKWYDFNGDGIYSYHAPYILQGHQALVFFLGGIPLPDPLPVPASGIFPNKFSMSGFGKDPTNPFTNNIGNDPRAPYNGAANAMYSGNRQAPFFEFVADRLLPDPAYVFFPGYLDTLGNSLSPGGAGTINFYAYFSAYGNGSYDPNDVNFVEYDSSGIGPQPPPLAGIALAFRVNFPVTGGCVSQAPNPYTSAVTIPATGAAAFLNPQSFQIISSGLDGQYGVGGLYSASANAEMLPVDGTTPSPYNTSDTSVRVRERDNMTNFHPGKLE
jgi:general secretion pathway protein G